MWLFLKYDLELFLSMAQRNPIEINMSTEMVYDHAENVDARWKWWEQCDGTAENVKILCDGTECECLCII